GRSRLCLGSCSLFLQQCTKGLDGGLSDSGQDAGGSFPLLKPVRLEYLNDYRNGRFPDGDQGLRGIISDDQVSVAKRRSEQGDGAPLYGGRRHSGQNLSCPGAQSPIRIVEGFDDKFDRPWVIHSGQRFGGGAADSPVSIAQQSGKGANRTGIFESANGNSGFEPDIRTRITKSGYQGVERSGISEDRKGSGGIGPDVGVLVIQAGGENRQTSRITEPGEGRHGSSPDLPARAAGVGGKPFD